MTEIQEELNGAIVKQIKIRHQYIEMMTAAYLSTTNIPPDKVELVEERDGYITRWFFMERKER